MALVSCDWGSGDAPRGVSTGAARPLPSLTYKRLKKRCFFWVWLQFRFCRRRKIRIVSSIPRLRCCFFLGWLLYPYINFSRERAYMKIRFIRIFLLRLLARQNLKQKHLKRCFFIRVALPCALGLVALPRFRCVVRQHVPIT